MRYTIKDFEKDYPNDDACLAQVFRESGLEDKACPKCDRETKYYKVNKRKCYACQLCGHHIYPLAGTIFHKSSTPLRDWFYAMFLFSTARNGVAAKELERAIGVTYKCAWRMAKQIRVLMSSADDKPQLEGTVEVDEAYVGGKTKKKLGRSLDSNKTVVFGMVERGGNAKAQVVEDASSYTLISQIRENVAVSTTVMSDKFRSYKNTAKFGYTHETINHSSKVYARGKVHTNTIEGFWSQIKRSIDGTHHVTSPKYLQLYLNEYVWRYNRRKGANLFPILVEQAGSVVKLS